MLNSVLSDIAKSTSVTSRVPRSEIIQNKASTILNYGDSLN